MAHSCFYLQANWTWCMLADVTLTSISMANAGIFYSDITHFWHPEQQQQKTTSYIHKYLFPIHPPKQTNRKQNSVPTKKKKKNRILCTPSEEVSHKHAKGTVPVMLMYPVLWGAKTYTDQQIQWDKVWGLVWTTEPSTESVKNHKFSVPRRWLYPSNDNRHITGVLNITNKSAGLLHKTKIPLASFFTDCHGQL